MKGKILGFTPAAGSGAITGDDGERFTFVAAQWRSDRPIAVGTHVDFAPLAGVATEIYPVAAAMPIAAGDLAASPAVQKIRRLAMTTLAFPLAALLLLATFLPAISGTSVDPRFPASSASLWGLGGLSKMISANPLLANDDVDSARAELKRLDAQEIDLRTHTTGFGGMPVDNSQQLAAVAEQRAQAEHTLSSAKFASNMTSLLVVRWAVPILAVALLWLVWTDKPVARISLATGVAAIVTAAIVYEYRQVIVGAGGAPEDSIGGMLSKQMDAMVSVGLGTYLIGLCGIGLVLAGLGKVKNPLAARVA